MRVDPLCLLDGKSKSRNLLERLRDFENDVLRFMEVDDVPFRRFKEANKFWPVKFSNDSEVLPLCKLY
jgi:hypothetical protein